MEFGFVEMRWKFVTDNNFFRFKTEVRMQHTDRAVKFLVEELRVCPRKQVKRFHYVSKSCLAS
jgi:hypothetical protein